MLEIFRRVFPYIERMLHFLRTDSRQEYLLGILATDRASLIAHLRSLGFEDQIFAWVDDGQVASMRKRVGVFQYHIRLFEDGEIRGHYEYTPEDAPLNHLRRVARDARRSQFLNFLEAHVIVESRRT